MQENPKLCHILYHFFFLDFFVGLTQLSVMFLCVFRRDYWKMDWITAMLAILLTVIAAIECGTVAVGTVCGAVNYSLLTDGFS